MTSGEGRNKQKCTMRKCLMLLKVLVFGHTSSSLKHDHGNLRVVSLILALGHCGALNMVSTFSFAAS